jgi:hypothetical protein
VWCVRGVEVVGEDRDEDERMRVLGRGMQWRESRKMI